ncbi:MAG: ABC transporter substrate-binding protein [Anaerolineae bacterium]|nr:ABC transporter substrate-binding protein [Anaerolineae bacterium]
MINRKNIRKTNRLRRRMGFGLILSVLLAAGLLAPLAFAAPNAQDDTPVLRIGYLGVLNSDAANGAQLAIDQINTIGGVTAQDGAVYQIELVALPSAPTAETLSSNVSKLTQQDVVAIIGPDDNTLLTPENVEALLQAGVPILSGATSNTLTDNNESILRMRAPERFYSAALAAYLTADLGVTTMILVQADVESTEAVADFESVVPTTEIVIEKIEALGGGDELSVQLDKFLSMDPQAVVFWGPAQDAVDLLRVLRSNGWQGIFAYRYAEQAARDGLVPDSLADGMLGVDSWTYTYTSRASRIFLRDYVVAFGQVPGPLSVAAYDAIWYLRAAVISQGASPDAILTGLNTGAAQNLVQGTLRPGDFGNGDLIRMALIYQLSARGAPVAKALYNDTQPQAIDISGLEVAEAPSNPTPGPSPTPGPPTETPFPTATLEGTWARINVNKLNVRTGPGANFDRIGQIDQDTLVRILGAIADYSWLTVDFQGGVGWVKTEYVTIEGNIAEVSIVPAPATPTPGATATPSLPPNPDIVIDTIVLSPAQPIPNQGFTATVTVRNTGAAAVGQFAVASTFEPGGVYASGIVNGLAGGQSTQTQLSATVTGTGVFTVAIVADLNNEIPEIDETNNQYQLTYRVDYGTANEQSGVQLGPNNSWDLFGGTVDFMWDGYNLAMQNGAMIGVLSGITYENAHYDAISPSIVNNSVGLGTDKVNTGAVFGIRTAEGRRAVLRIDNRQDTTIWFTYRVYNN